MRSAGLHWARRGCNPVTTCAFAFENHRPDLVQREFAAAAPDQLCGADITWVHLVAVLCFAELTNDVFTLKTVG